MKKLLTVFLIICMLFASSALAAETTFAEPFTIFDFGSDSRLDDSIKPNLLAGIKKYNCIMEENADSWTLTVVGAENFLDRTIVNPMAISGIGAEKIDQITYGLYKLNNGWGTYPAKAYSASSGFIYDETATWQGKNQFMKIRIKNMTDNTKISIMSASSAGTMGSNNSMIFDISANDEEFQVYIVDLASAAGRGFHRGMVQGAVPGTFGSSHATPWIGTGNQHPNTNTVILHPFGSASQGCDLSENTWHNIQDGDTVEVDYMIFAATPELAAEYLSYDEGYVAPETTTTEKVETTTTVEETTTTTKTEETSTTPSVSETTTTVVDETTTTEAIVDETTTVADETTTTEAIVDETTTTANDGTTTTVDGTTEKEGGFPIWIIIVIVVVIGGGVAAIFVFKKK